MEELVVYPKLEKSFTEMVESLCQDHVQSLLELKEKAYIGRICVFLKDALRGPHFELVCYSVRNLCENYLKMKSNRRGGESLMEIMALFDDQIGVTLPSFLARALHMIIFEECKHLFSIAGAILGLIIIFPAVIFISVLQLRINVYF